MKSLLTLLALWPLSGFAQTHGEVIGQVRSSESQAVAYATVTLYYGSYPFKTVLSDVDGVFIFDNLQPGAYWLAANNGSRNSSRVSVWVTGGVTYASLLIPRVSLGMCNVPSSGCVQEIERYLGKPRPKPGLLF